MTQMGQTLAPGSAGKSGAQIPCGQTEMHWMCICGGVVITDSELLPWGEVETYQLQRSTKKSREKKEASKFKLIHKPHCLKPLIIKPSSPQNQSTGKYQIMDLLCYPDTLFLKRRDHKVLMRNRNGICYPLGADFSCNFSLFRPSLAPSPAMTEEGISLCRTSCRAFQNMYPINVLILSCYHSGASKLDGSI